MNAMTLNQSYVLLAVAIVVAVTNFLGAYFAIRRVRAKRIDREATKPQNALTRSLHSSR
jgi:phosphotransferase system  glucose/maltose/N-acetylglucosamine-specific IIC component